MSPKPDMLPAASSCIPTLGLDGLGAERRDCNRLCRLHVTFLRYGTVPGTRASLVAMARKPQIPCGLEN